jgi:cell division septum initiation protein DivIVA
MDDDTMTALASRVAENLHGIFDERIEALRSEANATIEELRSTVSALEARIAGLEQTDENKVKQAVKDMPRLTGRITYRPRTVEANQPEPKEPGSLEEIAKATVSILK